MPHPHNAARSDAATGSTTSGARTPLRELKIDERVIRREVKKAERGQVFRLQGLKGFMIIVNAQSASYVLQRKMPGGKSRRIKIGLVGEISAEDALLEATEIAQQFRKGLDPNEERQARRVEGMTLTEAFELLKATKRGKWSPKTLQLNQDIFELHLSKWSNRTIEEIGRDRAGVNALHTSIQKSVAHRQNHRPEDQDEIRKAPPGWARANNALRLLSNIYTRARREVPSLPPNPAFGERHGGNVDFYPGRSRDTALRTEQLGPWYEQAQKLTNPVKRAYWLSVILTGGRREQIAESGWADVDFEAATWHFPRPKGGTARRYTVPVSEFLLKRLRQLREYTEQVYPNSPWVFPSNMAKSGHLTEPKNDRQGLPRAHALRHTYRTHGLIAGISDTMMCLLMNHKPPSQQRVSFNYITAEVTLDTLREAQERITSHFLKYFGIE